MKINNKMYGQEYDPNVLKDLAKEAGLDDLLMEMESDNETNKEEAE